MKSKYSKDFIELANHIEKIDKKIKACNLNGIGKEIFESNRIITSFTVIDGIGAFTNSQLHPNERKELINLKIKYDNTLSKLDNCSC